jgi:hypothetical protein
MGDIINTLKLPDFSKNSLWMPLNYYSWLASAPAHKGEFIDAFRKRFFE